MSQLEHTDLRGPYKQEQSALRVRIDSNDPPPVPSSQALPARRRVLQYVAIARPDHWFKNVFMVIGVLLAYFCHPEQFLHCSPWMILWAFAATCVIASSNYVINEILDAPTDRNHPVKCSRPIPSGVVSVPWAYFEWGLLGIAGAAMASAVNVPFLLAGLSLLVMGLVYNVRPVRSKELPYLDVLSEAVNNPIRLGLGWFVISPTEIPPLSLVISYWMVGAFFMATKRFAEYRSIADPHRAAAYRSSFRYYDEGSLLVSMFFYATSCSLFMGIFIVRYRLELLLSIPLIAGFFGYYLRVALAHNSCVQCPEKLYRAPGLMIYLCLCLIVFIVLMFVHIPSLYRWFNVDSSLLPPLWRIG